MGQVDENFQGTETYTLRNIFVTHHEPHHDMIFVINISKIYVAFAEPIFCKITKGCQYSQIALFD